MSVRWPLGLYRIAGNSMLPTYAAGDVLLGIRWFKPRVGKVVAARTDHRVIKRITASAPEGFELMGDNANSSRYEGVGPDQFEAWIVLRVAARPERVAG